MKLILVAALLVSLGNDPAMILALDNDHSIGVVSEHGIDHLIFFHRAVESGSRTVRYFATPEHDEHHEVHLASSTGLVKKRLQITSQAIDTSFLFDALLSLKTVPVHSVDISEPDVGKILPAQLILRI